MRWGADQKPLPLEDDLLDLSLSHSPVEHRPQTILLHFSRALSFASWWMEFQLCPFLAISFSRTPLQVSLGFPLFLFPCGVHWRAWQVMLDLPSLKVWPIHFHFLFLISCGIGIWLVLLQRSSFVILFGHHIWRMLGRWLPFLTLSLSIMLQTH